MLIPSIHTKSLTLFSLLLLLSLLSACDNSGSEKDDDNESYDPTAFFFDSAVKGLKYNSASHNGITDSLGGFEYTPDETTSFSYQGLAIGSVDTPVGSSTFTPLDVFGTSDTNDQRVKNLLVLLQSLDRDQDPTNGISLINFNETDELVSAPKVDLSSLDLTINNTDFQNSLLTAAFTNNNFNPHDSLVAEEDAIAHFNSTLEALRTELSQLEGTWIARNDNGEISYKHTYTSNGELNSIEYDCTDDGIYRAPSLASVEKNCPKRSLAHTYEYSNKTISIFNKKGKQVDTCHVIQSTPYYVDTTCSAGSITHLERVITSLDENLVEGTYRLISPGHLEYATMEFSLSSNAGSYTYFGSEGTSEGTFDSWSASDSSLNYVAKDKQTSTTESEELTLTNKSTNISGALVTTNSTNAKKLLIPNFKTSVVNNLINQSYYAIYDAISGKCKAVYKFDGHYSNEMGLSLQRKNSSDSNEYVCNVNYDEAPEYTSESPEANIEPISIRKGAFEIMKDGQLEFCWPIKSTTTGEGGSYSVFACSQDEASNFSYEIWYSM